jgi:acyl carrier protein
MKKIKEAVNEVVYNVLRKHNITKEMIIPNAHVVNDLKADSLDIIEMMLGFEDLFNINIEEERIQEIKSIQDIYDFIYNELQPLVKIQSK